MEKKKVLVLCTGNSCRSQMAEAYLRHFAKEKVEVYSAGIETHGVNQNAIATMKQDGIDISHHTSNHIEEYAKIDFDIILTVCDHAKEQCPIFSSNALQFHQNFSDPAKVIGTDKEISEAFKKVREEIKSYSKNFLGKI